VHEALGLESPERVAKRDAAHPEPVGELLLPETLARTELAGQDRVAQGGRDDLFDAADVGALELGEAWCARVRIRRRILPIPLTILSAVRGRGETYPVYRTWSRLAGGPR
jgi:hypothetical protein